MASVLGKRMQCRRQQALLGHLAPMREVSACPLAATPSGTSIVTCACGGVQLLVHVPRPRNRIPCCCWDCRQKRLWAAIGSLSLSHPPKSIHQQEETLTAKSAHVKSTCFAVGSVNTFDYFCTDNMIPGGPFSRSSAPSPGGARPPQPGRVRV